MPSRMESGYVPPSESSAERTVDGGAQIFSDMNSTGCGSLSIRLLSASQEARNDKLHPVAAVMNAQRQVYLRVSKPGCWIRRF